MLSAATVLYMGKVVESKTNFRYGDDTAAYKQISPFSS